MSTSVETNTFLTMPPPPPPPPLPDKTRPLESLTNIDLVNTINMKPNMKMRTLNWRRIPKKKVLGQHVDITTSEGKNLWFLIAKANNSIKEKEDTEDGRSSLSSSSKSALKIREMLESVRRRMAAITMSDQNEKERNIMNSIDFDHLESLFCLPSESFDPESPNFVRRSSLRTNASSDSVISSNSNYSSNTANEDDEDLSFIEYENILDSKKSLNVNIFLKQLKSPSDLIDQIKRDDRSSIGKERIENLLKLIPDEIEQTQLMKFFLKNKQHKLPVAEKFLLQLITEVPNVKLRIKFMLLREEYSTDFGAISPDLDKIDQAAKEIRESKMLRDILNLVLITGNFLNTGGYAADAAGFSLDCLEKLGEVKSNKPNVFLIHYVAEVALKLNLIDFLQSELPHVEPASKVCIESIKLDLSSMMDKITELKSDTNKEMGTSAIEDQNQPFLLNLLETLNSIKSNVEFLSMRTTENLERARKQLADYLCDDPDTFKLHDCFHNILAFSRRLKIASDENERRYKIELSRLDRSSCSLRRSNTINPWLMKSALNRQSLGDMRPPKQTSSFSCHPNGIIENRRTTLGYAPEVSQSSLSRTTSTFNLSNNTEDTGHDDLHEGLMRMLEESNNRRAADIQNRSKVRPNNTNRRSSRLFASSKARLS